MLVEIDLEYFRTVYLKTDPEQLPRQITKIEVLPGGSILYGLNSGSLFSTHYREEISLEIDTVLKSST